MGLGPPTPHENGLAYAGRGSGNVALSWYARVRSESDVGAFGTPHCRIRARRAESCTREAPPGRGQTSPGGGVMDQLIERSEEHTSELQSQSNLVCRLLLE